MKLMHESRILPIEGGYNFRDLGGIITGNKTIIKSNYLIRTDELSRLNTNDLEFLADLNVKTVVDFRTAEERKSSIDRVPSTCKNEFHLDIMAANMNAFMQKMQSGLTDYKHMMQQFYSDLVLEENAMKEFKEFFSILQIKENCSVIYHCTAGKDRTGIATALILKSLNVDWNTIESDYLLSNQFLEKKYAAYIEQNPSLANIFLVNAEYLQGAFEKIVEKYYSVDDYLTDHLNVDIDLMRKIYTK
ncbi:MAG: tyrosine-protein phosphatase [Weeksellaceae bacterium]|nr:tyrosine-protein phosphatase [Weeksellaceae bacterium]